MSDSGQEILPPSTVATMATMADPARNAPDHQRRVRDLRATGADGFVIGSPVLSLSA
jgi:hypothetical protein